MQVKKHESSYMEQVEADRVFNNDILEHSQWFIHQKLLAASSCVLWNHVKAWALSGETSGKEMKDDERQEAEEQPEQTALTIKYCEPKKRNVVTVWDWLIIE